MNDEQHPGGNPTESGPGAALPRWVKAFLIAVIAIVLLMAVAMVVTGGQHGPSRHLSSLTLRETAAPHDLDPGRTAGAAVGASTRSSPW